MDYLGNTDLFESAGQDKNKKSINERMQSLAMHWKMVDSVSLFLFYVGFWTFAIVRLSAPLPLHRFLARFGKNPRTHARHASPDPDVVRRARAALHVASSFGWLAS